MGWAHLPQKGRMTKKRHLRLLQRRIIDPYKEKEATNGKGIAVVPFCDGS